MATFLNAAREVKSCEKADILTLTFLHTFLIFLKIDQGVHTISLNCTLQYPSIIYMNIHI